MGTRNIVHLLWLCLVLQTNCRILLSPAQVSSVATTAHYQCFKQSGNDKIEMQFVYTSDFVTGTDL